MEDQNPLEDLIHMVQILFEEPDKLQRTIDFGAKTVRNYFVFTCLGECQDTYAISATDGAVYYLNHIDSIPETGTIVTDEEEIVCIIACLLEFIQNTPGIKPVDWSFLNRTNPKNYTPGKCFSPC